MTARNTLEIGHRRPDGKYNVWRYMQLGANPFVLDWVIVRVVDSYKDAMQAIERMLDGAKRKGKPQHRKGTAQ